MLKLREELDSSKKLTADVVGEDRQRIRQLEQKLDDLTTIVNAARIER